MSRQQVNAKNHESLVEGRIRACRSIVEHMTALLLFGRCGCWDEGRNRSAYWGWKGSRG